VPARVGRQLPVSSLLVTLSRKMLGGSVPARFVCAYDRTNANGWSLVDLGSRVLRRFS
jgi:hypothetical protein